jgi:hypothetical protein
MAKTYAELRKEIARTKYIDMEIPHPNGNVYLITAKREGFFNEVYRCEMASKSDSGSMGWFVVSVSQKDYTASDISCVMGDLETAFEHLMPTT